MVNIAEAADILIRTRGQEETKVYGSPILPISDPNPFISVVGQFILDLSGGQIWFFPLSGGASRWAMKAHPKKEEVNDLFYQGHWIRTGWGGERGYYEEPRIPTSSPKIQDLFARARAQGIDLNPRYFC